MASNMELYLRALLGEDVDLPVPISRNEKQLAAMLGEDVQVEPPISRIEVLLDQLRQNGGGGADELKAVIDRTVTDITLPSDLTEIGEYAFRGCKHLALTSLPDSVKIIRNSAFYGCTNLALTS